MKNHRHRCLWKPIHPRHQRHRRRCHHKTRHPRHHLFCEDAAAPQKPHRARTSVNSQQVPTLRVARSPLSARPSDARASSILVPSDRRGGEVGATKKVGGGDDDVVGGSQQAEAFFDCRSYRGEIPHDSHPGFHTGCVTKAWSCQLLVLPVRHQKSFSVIVDILKSASILDIFA